MSMASTATVARSSAALSRPKAAHASYPSWFYLPAAIIYGLLFLYPTIASLFFSLTRWTLFDATFIGLENFAQFFREPFLIQGLYNTVIYGVVTSGLKVVLGLLLALLLTAPIIGQGYLRAVVFFPVLVSTIGVGITFTVLMHPTQGAINETLARTVMTAVTKKTSASDRVVVSRVRTTRTDTMREAVTISTPDRAANGTCETRREAR